MHYRAITGLLFATAAFAAEPTARLPDRPTAPTGPLDVITKVHKFSIVMTPAEYTALQRSQVNRGGFSGGPDNTEDDIREADGRMVHIGGGFGGYFPWVHADIKSEGGSWVRDVGLRLKGNGSYNQGAGLHRNLKIKTEFFGAKSDWEGFSTLNFNSGGRDYSRLRETLAFAIFRAAGVPASRTALAEVNFTVTGGLHTNAYGGLFTLIENVNTKFLKHALPPGTGLLMKPERMQGGVGYYGIDWQNYIPWYRPEREATPKEQVRVIQFATLVNTGSVADFRARIGDFVDIDEFLRFLAVNAMIVSRDSYLSGRHNYFIYLDPKDDRFRFIPWDEDGSLDGGGGRGGFGGSNVDLMNPFSADNPLGYWLLDDPAIAARYRAIVKDIHDKIFNRDALNKLLDSLEPVVRDPLLREGVDMASRGEYNNPGQGGTPRAFFDQRVSTIEAQLRVWFPEARRAEALRSPSGEARAP